MELYAAESAKIKTLVQDWLDHPEHELEATFGAGGVVDATTFLAIAQRLRTKGYEPLPQDDRLSILTQKNIRLSLQGLGVLQSYCRDDRLDGKPFTALIKDRSSAEANLDLEEYNCRIKSRREIPLSQSDPLVSEIINNWTQVDKAYRLIKRWTFRGNGVRIDMSIVRSTPKDSRGQFRWARRFTDLNIFKQPASYEVEVELLRDGDTATIENASRSLIRGIGEILRAIQKNTLLIRKSVRDRVMSEYIELNGSDRFRGVAPVTLEKANMSSEIEDGKPNIRTGYNVTDKADGLRALGFCDRNGEMFLIDMGMNVYRTGLKSEACAKTLVDGEWVTRSKAGKAINHFLVFDIYKQLGGEDVGSAPFVVLGAEAASKEHRWKMLQEWIKAWQTGEEIVNRSVVTPATHLQVALKRFLFADAENPRSVFLACAQMLDSPHIYNTDGLILTPNGRPLPARSGETFFEQFKWKPARDNTIDFLASFEKSEDISTLDKVVTGVHPISGETVQYKILRLYVGSSKDQAYENPRTTVLDMLPLPDPRQSGKQVYKPILFAPEEFPDTMANTCYRAIEVDPETGEEYVMTEDTHEPIQDNSIVEMRYEPHQEAGWRWVPMRVRHDKTERLQRKQIARTLNSEKVANSVWNSIHDPITESMIRSGAEEPTEAEVAALSSTRAKEIGAVYYQRSAKGEDLAIVRGLRDFHNKYVKEDIIYRTILLDGGRGSGGKKLIDFACGKGGDLQKWRRGRVGFVLGVDNAGDNILNASNGAYRRYLDTLVNNRRDRVAPMIFSIVKTSSDPLITGEAGVNGEERDILRTVFGRVAPEGPVPKMVMENGTRLLASGADAGVVMFALHYFFESAESVNGLLKNIGDCVKEGGYFAGCCFDGERVFNMLRGVETGESKVGMEGDVPLWTIKKSYAADELLDDESSVGLAIDVDFISIGTEHREYLVNFNYLVRRLKEIGFELLNEEELRTVGLRKSTNMFEESYEMAAAAKKNYQMSDAVKEFSFLNRWFIFKKRGVSAADAVAAVAAVAAVPAAAPEEDLRTSIEPRGEKEEAVIAAAAASAMRAPVNQLPGKNAVFAASAIFLFGPAVALQDTLKMGDAGAGRWLALNAPFAIRDTETGVEYPSMEHYIFGMIVKYGGKNATVSANLFGSNGSIHQKFESERRLKTGTGGKLSDTDYYALLKDESAAVKKAMMPSELRAYGVKIAEADWLAQKDRVLREGLTQRWERDARFRRVVEEAREKSKYLLYYIGPSGTGELSGVRRANDGRIEGENKIGRIIMELAGFRF